MSLFEEDTQPKKELPPVEGLRYIPDFITQEQQTSLLAQIDKEPWLTDLKRRVQHYGYKYDYLSRSITKESYLGPIPTWLQIDLSSIFQEAPDQIIINEYLPGQGIAAHTDCIPCFKEVIASLSLGGSCVMTFTKDIQKHSMLLQPNSLLVLSGPARYEWQHSIPARKTDIINSSKFVRTRRVSLTFRTVIK